MIDKTFKINKLGLILLVIIGITVIIKNFLTTYSFVKSEVIVLFNFLFNSFKYFVFNNNIVEARIVLNN